MRLDHRRPTFNSRHWMNASGVLMLKEFCARATVATQRAVKALKSISECNIEEALKKKEDKGVKKGRREWEGGCII